MERGSTGRFGSVIYITALGHQSRFYDRKHISMKFTFNAYASYYTLNTTSLFHSPQLAPRQ